MALSDPSRRLYPDKEDFISEEHLKETERILKNLESSPSEATSLVKTWVAQREKSIEAIGRLQKKLDNLHRACNVANGVGAAMQVLGGLAMVTGTILTPYGYKAVGEFLTKRVSTVSVGTGLAASGSSSAAEITLAHMTMKEVKRVLEKDEEYTKLLVERFQFSRTIDKYLRSIFNCSILSDNFLVVVRLVQEGISLLEVGYVAYSELKEELKCKATKGADILKLNETVIQNVLTTMEKISSDQEVRKAVWNICDIIQKSPSAFEFFKLGLRLSFQICDILKVDIITSLLGIGILKTSAGVMATKCLMGAVLVAINVLSVISAIQNAKEGTSRYSKSLKELNLALVMELNTVNNSYMCPKLL